MMVSPQWYYEECLKGKSAEEISKEIRSLKRKIGHLKKVVANPQEYRKEWMICPSPEVQLEMYCLYLQQAVKARMDSEEYLEKTGAQPSINHLRDRIFRNVAEYVATQPVQILAKPGMGVDEGYMIVYNEMNRIIAMRKAKNAAKVK